METCAHCHKSFDGRDRTVCVVTKMVFCMDCSSETTCTVVGDMWCGLWHNSPFVMNDEDMVLIPHTLVPFVEAVMGRKLLDDDIVCKGASFYFRG